MSHKCNASVGGNLIVRNNHRCGTVKVWKISNECKVGWKKVHMRHDAVGMMCPNDWCDVYHGTILHSYMYLYISLSDTRPYVIHNTFVQISLWAMCHAV